MKYRHTQNGSIGTVVERNEKSKTTILEFEDGKSKSYSDSTLKRWWEVVEDDAPVVEKTDEVQEIPVEEKAGDGTPLAEVGKEIVEQAKQKAKAEVLPIEERQRLVSEALHAIGFKTVITEKSPKVVHILDSQGKKTRGVYLGDRKCVLGLRAEDVPDGATADRVRNLKISHSFDLQYDGLDRLSTLLAKVQKEEKYDGKVLNG